MSCQKSVEKSNLTFIYLDQPDKSEKSFSDFLIVDFRAYYLPPSFGHQTQMFGYHPKLNPTDITKPQHGVKRFKMCKMLNYT